MTQDDFISKVRNQGGLGSDAEARAVTEAVLATLGECLELGEYRGLASQLPQGIGEYLDERQPERPRRDVATISRAEFLNRVRARAKVNQSQANAATGAVVAALQQAVSEGEINHLRNRLPQDLSELFA